MQGFADNDSNTRDLSILLEMRRGVTGGYRPDTERFRKALSIDGSTALRSLPPADQEALPLVEWEGVVHAVGGKITDCSANTFKVRVHRARQRLAAVIEYKCYLSRGYVAEISK